MNKILIVGHPASGCQDVEALLHQCGMHAALPSRREGLLPQDVTATLCKAHKAPPAESVVTEEDFRQIDAGPVWHGMALDLMLGNLDQALWGWADPQAIYALDYWKGLDPKLTFVLVYDEPHRVLIEASRHAGHPLSAASVEQALDNWAAYNGALLRFYLRHPGRCLLVHAQQVRHAVDDYLQQLQPLLDTPLALTTAADLALELPPPAQYDGAGASGDSDSTGLIPAALRMDVQPPIASGLALAASAVGLEPREAASLMDTAAAERYLVDGMLAHHPAAQQLYAELQSSANLPLDQPTSRQGDPAEAWSALVRQRAFVSGLVVQLHSEYLRMQDEYAQAREQAESQAAVLRQEIGLLAAQAEAGEQLAKVHAHENELLLGQLHEVQEDLERQSLRKQALEQITAELEREIQHQAAEAQRALEAERAAAEKAFAEIREMTETETVHARQQIAQLTAQSEANGQRAKEYALENELLLNQLHEVQEELERQFHRKHELEKLSADLGEKIQHQGAEAKRAQEAEKAAAAKALAEMREKHEDTAKQLAAVRSQLEADKAARAKAEVVQVAASDKKLKELGEENELLLTQLHQVQEELERYYLDNQRLKQKVSPPKPPAPYGAVQRVKRQLSYRLGATMIDRSRSVGGWLGMPWALAAEAREFRKERAARPDEKLPPLHIYRDAHEAERVKQHLSYRLGNTLLKHGKSPVGWLKLPFALRREVRQFRLQRTGA